jgi:hypothetical protein
VVTYHVIPHGHRDRAWCLTPGHSRVRIVSMMGGMLALGGSVGGGYVFDGGSMDGEGAAL